MTQHQLEQARALGWTCDPKATLAYAVLSALLWLEITYAAPERT